MCSTVCDVTWRCYTGLNSILRWVRSMRTLTSAWTCTTLRYLTHLMPYATVIKQMMTWDISEPKFERLHWPPDLFLWWSIVTVLVQAEPLNAVPSGLGGRWTTKWLSCQINQSRPLSRKALISQMTIRIVKSTKVNPPSYNPVGILKEHPHSFAPPPPALFSLYVHPVVKFLCPTLVCKTVGYFQRDEEHGRLWR